MKQIATTLVLLAGFACRAESRNNFSMVHDFDAIKSSAELTWTPCFDGFTCSRLQVPLDYSNQSLGTASIAFMKWAGKNATADSQSFVIIPADATLGGPGGSSIDLLQSYKDKLGNMFGDMYNFVAFDPRGVGRSSPRLDCFRNNTKARTAFNRAHYMGATNTSSASLEEQYYSAAIYGEWCDEAVKTDSPYGYYVTTPAVARDLLSFVEAEAKLAGRSPPSKAKLWGFGLSYGTVIGTTFASLFPDRVGRLVLESVMDVDQYYANDWRSVFVNSDEAFAQLPLLCHAAGPDRCSFWGPSPENITARMDGIIENIKDHPIPVSGIDGWSLPGLATYSDLKYFLADGIYEPLTSFPIMADMFVQLEKGNASALIGRLEKMYLGADDDGGVIIRCADSYRANKLTTMEEWKHYIQDTVSSSKYIGDIFPIWARTILCRSIHAQLPDSMMIQGQVTGIGKPMSFPILFTGNTVDPVAPAANARKMSSRFPGSIVLLQEAVGVSPLNQYPIRRRLFRETNAPG
ncbi:hypothetical protein PGQ11_013380 [Apiospora arundinis]|uniref:AB hydrolase-1 domain-containing protein n=1 Tax=Apiospora arundinis TaxID=335852 RepID=A0ABR2HP31_9PEZI